MSATGITGPKCATCGARTRWVEDAWVCTAARCQDEWYPDHGPEYAKPWAQDEIEELS